LARRLVLHDQTLPATIITSKTLSREDKLMALAHEELIMSAFHRPRPGHVASMVRLHEALIQAGVDVLKEPGFRAFASATGISPAALKPYWHTETSK
jgi:tRNA G26 N,N-dimethylase Trm1